MLTVTDGNSDSGQFVFEFIVVCDPDGGFVTGGGWIWSPEEAYTPDPKLTGRANSGFVSKYKKGATTPSGNTGFNFQVADLDFHSDSCDWLVIAGARARCKETGTIDDEDQEYRFMLQAKDLDPDVDDAFRT